MNQETNQLLTDFLLHLDGFYKDLGVFTSQKTRQEIGREFLNKFYNNLVCLQNYYLTKDSAGSALIQRYNHELVIDLYYLLDPSDDEDKINKFFNYNNKSTNRDWSKLKISEKRKFIPPWVANNKSLASYYKTLSNMAHSNIISIQLCRRGTEYEFNIIQKAIFLCILDVATCLNQEILRCLFTNINWEPIYEKNLFFQDKVINLFNI